MSFDETLLAVGIALLTAVVVVGLVALVGAV